MERKLHWGGWSPVVLGILVGLSMADEPTVRTMTAEFAYVAQVPVVPSGTQVMELWMPVPSNTPWQTVRVLQVDSPVPYRITRERKYGNRMVYVRVENPREPISVTVRFRVERREVRVLAGSRYNGRFKAVPAVDRRRFQLFLQPNRLVPVGDVWEILAREVTEEATTVLEKARAIYDHIVATMQYDYQHESPKRGQGDVAFVCDFKKGNCLDLHSYAMALLRSLGIPAYVEMGFPITGIPVSNTIRREGAIGGYHCWAWVYMPGLGWMPMDASDGRRWRDAGFPSLTDYLYGNLLLERSAVAFSRGRDIVLAPPQRGEPLNSFIYPYAEADGQPVEATWELRYRLITAPTPAFHATPFTDP